MNRLTRKTDGRDYCLYCRQVEFDNEVLERNDTLLYEEPQDYYNRFPYQTSEVGNEEEILNKLGELEDIEEELGISLPILFKAIETKIYAKAHHYKTGKPSILDFEEPRLIKHEEWCLVGTCGTFTYCVALKDYGKTWWLKEDLKSE